MKNTKKMILRTAAVGMTACTMSIAVLPIHADDSDTVTKKEDVFAVLNTDGTVNKTTVTDTLHSDTGFHNYNDVSHLKDAQNLKSTDELTRSSDGYVWNTEDTDIYYQGTYDSTLPLSAAISYSLDGKEIKEEDLLGQSGHVKITIDLTNTKYQYYQVNGTSYKVALPIAAVAGAMFSKDVFSNVSINGGEVTSDSSHDIAASVSLPGMKDSLEKIFVAGTLSSLDAYLNDEIVIEADAKEYEAPEMMIAASSNISDLKDELKDTDLSSVWNDIDQLQSATDELVAGTKSLYDGAGQLSDGSSSLSAGTDELVSGAAALADGSSQLSAGADALSAGLGQLSASSKELNAGAKQIQDSVFATASKEINADANVIASGKTYELTAENYADDLAELLEINDAERAQAKAQIKKSLDDAVSAKTGSASNLDDSTVNALIYMAGIHSTDAGFNADLASQAARLISAQTVQKYAAGYTSKTAAMQNAKVAAILNAVVNAKKNASYSLSDSETAVTKAQIIAAAKQQSAQLSSLSDDAVWTYLMNNQYIGLSDSTVIAAAFKNSISASQVYDAIAAQLKSANSSLSDADIAAMIAYTADTYSALDASSLNKAGTAMSDAEAAALEMQNSAAAEGQQKIKSTLNVLVASSDSYQTSSQAMKELQTSLDGLCSFTEGLKKYTDGVDSAYSGSQTLASKTAELAKGASSLSQGATQLKTGIDALSAGINTLKDGSETLMNGMAQYSEEGISKLTGSSETKDLRNATELLDQIKKNGESYNNYSGISDGTEGTVKFIYKVKTVKTEKEDTASASNTDVTHVNDGSNIFSRIADLFIFWK
ncbi:MAG: hypothetical protein LKF53_04635 [Solobacterium sp.]|jgi:putative membrane protein|nr:hypothetical protein [Solobacterium sp.]MCH4205660.1 hypothetical protein [Solobacterium sp.]MCH4227147.1 hypothetical protein [Solobacterium sp.]MCH4282490.1 hypothetical protein [Solobacterium sp.]